jgi:predicted nucleic acid-binding protein
VLATALIAEGPPSRLLEAAIDGRIELVLPGLVLDELRRVLVDKLGFDDEHAGAANDLLAAIAASQPESPSSADEVTGDAADDRILACALEARVDVLATGDRKHLLPLAEHHGVRILTPQATLAELRARDRLGCQRKPSGNV